MNPQTGAGLVGVQMWVHSDQEDWFIQFGKDNYDELDLERENECIRARQKRVKEGWMAMFSNE